MNKPNSHSSQEPVFELLGDDELLDDDILQQLAENQQAMELPANLQARMRGNIMQQVAEEAAGVGPGFTTVRAGEGEWMEALPGGFIKILQPADANGALAYLARLEPGFEMPGHVHAVDEECIMLEGELWMGDLHLRAGDYHFAAKGMNHGKHRTDTGALIYLKGALPL